MKSILTISFVSFVLILTGCSAETRARIEADQQRRSQEFLSAKHTELQNSCDRYGFKRGTVEFANCMQQADAQWNNNYNASIQQRNQALKNMNDAFKPPQIVPVCPGMLNARPGQYGPNC